MLRMYSSNIRGIYKSEYMPKLKGSITKTTAPSLMNHRDKKQLEVGFKFITRTCFVNMCYMHHHTDLVNAEGYYRRTPESPLSAYEL